MERVVVTGGPGSGRFEMVKALLKYQSYTASRLFIATNPSYWELTDNRNPAISWHDVFEWQVYIEPKKDLPCIDCIVHSCGFSDIEHFAPDDEFDVLCERYNIGEMKKRYTAIIFLDTVAKTYPEKYPYTSNEDDISLYEAVILSDKLRSNWIESIGRDRVYTIPATSTFEHKMIQTLYTLEGIICKDTQSIQYKILDFASYLKSKEN